MFLNATDNLRLTFFPVFRPLRTGGCGSPGTADGSELIVFLSGDLQDEEDRTLHVCQECIEKIFISVVAPMDGGKGFFPASEGGTFGRA